MMLVADPHPTNSMSETSKRRKHSLCLFIHTVRYVEKNPLQLGGLCIT